MARDQSSRRSSRESDSSCNSSRMSLNWQSGSQNHHCKSAALRFRGTVLCCHSDSRLARSHFAMSDVRAMPQWFRKWHRLCLWCFYRELAGLGVHTIGKGELIGR